MRQRYKVFIIIFSVLSIITLMVVVLMMINPIYRSETSIRRYLLNITPIGTYMTDTITILEKNGWGIRTISHTQGVVFSRNSSRPISFVDVNERPGFTDVGKRSLSMHMGNGRFIIFDFAVLAFYAFDEENRLIEIFVWKMYDSL